MSMSIVKIDLQQMLDARERRKQRQDELLKKYSHTLVCFTMNIAGEIKNSPRIEAAFRFGAKQLFGLEPIYYVIYSEPTGMEGFFIYKSDADEIKKHTCAIEEGSPVGRLFDMDVFDASGEKASRQTERNCIVCSGPVKACARNRTHGLEAILKATDCLLDEFLAQLLSSLAVESLIEEVRVTPKPGLVDMNNNGSHSDMDVELFTLSAESLSPFFFDAAMLGLTGEISFQALHQIGLNSEQAMLRATNGVNTHKGANYSFLLLLCSIGLWFRTEKNPFETVSWLAGEGELPKNTHGSMVRTKYGNIGIIAEACGGLTHARTAAKLLCELPPEQVLLHIISTLEDTNILFRSGEEALNRLRGEAARILLLSAETRNEAILELDRQCIEQNISPGGSADTLALALFLWKLRFYSTNL